MYYYVELEMTDYLMDCMELEQGRLTEFQQLVKLFKTPQIRNMICIGCLASYSVAFIFRTINICEDDETGLVTTELIKKELTKIISTYMRKISSGVVFDIVSQFNRVKLNPMKKKEYRVLYHQGGILRNKLLGDVKNSESRELLIKQMKQIKGVTHQNIDTKIQSLGVLLYTEDYYNTAEALKSLYESNYFLNMRTCRISRENMNREINLLRISKRRKLVFINDYQELKTSRMTDIKRNVRELMEKHTFIIAGLDSDYLLEKADYSCIGKELVSPSHKKSSILQPVAIDGIIKDIDGLIGMDEAKKVVKEIVITTYVEKNIWKTNKSIANHFMFAGNPGTGKTTLARYLAKGLYMAGTLSRNKLLEVDRGGLVGNHVGSTAIKTIETLEEANGGVLLIDEAYGLYSNSPSDFGKEAIHTIVKYMEDHRDELSIIFAGYKTPMNQLFKMNQGLRSRINHHINFQDYNQDELMRIFHKIYTEESFEVTRELEDKLYTWFGDCLSNKNEEFANGRFVRNLFEKMKRRSAYRIFFSRDQSGKILTLEDFGDLSLENTIDKEKVRRIGFVS